MGDTTTTTTAAEAGACAGRVIIVSNRLPVSVDPARPGRLVPSSGGLVSGLRGFLGDKGSTWIGWPGVVAQGEEPAVSQALSGSGCRPVFLPGPVADSFYEGYCNAVLWPLCHMITPANGPLNNEDTKDKAQGWWDSYVTSNEMFSREVESVHRDGDVVWVHDYHLMLLPGMIRRSAPKATIGLLLHIPFPPSEVAKTLPKCKELIAGMLQADLVAFHTSEYASSFSDCASKLLGWKCNGESTLKGPHDGRLVKVTALPMGIDYERLNSAAQRPLRREVAEAVDAFRSRLPLGEGRLVLSLSRLDYTKGIVPSLQAVRALLHKRPELRERLVFLLVVVPSRERVGEYSRLLQDIQRNVGEINGELSTPRWSPVVYLHRSLSLHETVAAYAASDVALIVPVRDGQNLVALEWCSVHASTGGSLVLSKMAGAAHELPEALLVNPGDAGGVVEALEKALDMNEDEQRTRLRKMSKRLAKRDVHHWVGSLFKNLLATKDAQRELEAPLITREVEIDVLSRLHMAKERLVLLDYDGTLVPFYEDPNDAVPDKALIDLLWGLSRLPETKVVVLSGRDRQTLGQWLGGVPVTVVAEHGAWILHAGGYGWERTDLLPQSEVQDPWWRSIRKALQEAAAVLPGSFVEASKSTALVFHYRRAHKLVEESRIDECVRELKAALGAVTTGLPVRIVDAKEAVEVRSSVVDKGRCATRILETLLRSKDEAFVFAMGDDETDEDMFKALSRHCTVRVGRQLSRAHHSVEGVPEARALLSRLLAATGSSSSNGQLEE